MSSIAPVTIKEKPIKAFPVEQYQALLRTMLLSRIGDEREASLIRQGKGWFHIAGMGHEAMAVFASLLEKEDYCAPYYRDRAFVLERGQSNYDLALSFFAKKESSSGGRQLPGHHSNRALNIWSHLSPVSAQCLPACGIAWGMKMDGKKNVVYVSIGEAATRQGDFYEAVCFAKEKQLPIVFVVQDGRVSISSFTETTNPLALGMLARSEWTVIDGTHAEEAYAAASKAITHAREGNGPAFIWAKLERLCSHSSADDHRRYRTEEDLEAIVQRDPIYRLKNQLIEDGHLTETEYEALEAKIKAQVVEDYKKAEQAANPQPGEEMLHNTAGTGTPTLPVLKLDTSYRMADAVNETFKHVLETNPNTCFFGEDIEDPLGGVFRLTKDLSSEYPNRVFNSPLAESTILGIACGLASYGKFPIFELQFVDFIFPGWNQLINNLSNLRWRSYGDWSCPCIIYAPYGGYLPAGGVWHSQAHEAAFAHFPGMHVVIPSTPEDASGLIATAMTCQDPVIILLPKHLLWVTKETPNLAAPIPIGKAAVRQEGTDVTVVSWGNCIHIVETLLEKESHLPSVELIDLRSIAPWDEETIAKSVLETGRLVIVQEDNRSCSAGQMILSTLLEREDIFKALVTPPILISKDTVQIGFNPIYEYSALPSEEQILKAIRSIMSIQVTREYTILKDESAPSVATTAHTVKLPNLGEGLREARIVSLHKKEGDTVKDGEALCEVETDKAIFPVESPVEGVLSEWIIKEEDVLAVGEDLAVIQLEGAAPESTPLTLEATPVLNSEGQGGLSSQTLSQMQGVLPASLNITANWSAIKAARVGPNRRITTSTIVAWCALEALKKNPSFRRVLQGGGIVSAPKDIFDLGIAVALENDVLETAVVQKANQLSFDDFVIAYRNAVKAIENGERPSKASTPLIISNMSAYQIRSGQPIVVPPAMAVLFIGNTFFEHQKGNDEPTLEEVSSLCITFDHRWINGAGGAKFLKDVKEAIEAFVL